MSRLTSRDQPSSALKVSPQKLTSDSDPRLAASSEAGWTMNLVRCVTAARRCLDYREIRRISHGPRTLCFSSSALAFRQLQPRRNKMTAQKPGTALITGASTGIGAIYADRLA